MADLSPKQVHELDQMVAGTRTLAAAFAGMYAGLVEGRVPPDHAVQITSTYVMAATTAMLRPPGATPGTTA